METAPLLRPSSHLQETPSAHCNGRLHTRGLNQPWIRNLSGGKRPQSSQMQILKLLTIRSGLPSVNTAAGIKSDQQMTRSTREERPSLHGNTTARHFTQGRGLSIRRSWHLFHTRLLGPIPGKDEGRTALRVLGQRPSTAPQHHLAQRHTHSLLLRAALFWAIWKYLPKLLM